MSWERQAKNQRTKERDKEEHSAARWALEYFRSSGDSSGFPDLRYWLFTKSFAGHRHWSLEGFRYPDVTPRLSETEYDKMKEAYLQTEEGRADTWKIEGW